MAVVRMARAPSSYRSSMIRCASLAATMERTATQPSWCRGDGRRLQARGEGDRALQVLDAAVVVHHHVAAGDQDALEPAQELLHLGLVVRGADAADDDGFRLHDRFADDLESGVAQAGAGLDDVGDDLRDAEFDGGLDGAVQVDDVRVDADFGEVLGDDALVGGGDRQPVEVLRARGRAGLGGVAEGRTGETELEDLLRLGTGVLQQVAAGDADVETARADVDRDVTGPQVEELHLVLGVDENELLGLLALLVAGLMEHRHRRP